MTSTNSDDIVLGPRKRKETARVTENADPLLPKNKKAKTSAQPKLKPKAARTAQSGPSQCPSLELEDEENLVQRTQPTNPNHVLEAADGSDDNDGGPEPDVIDVGGTSEEPEESAENELST